MATTEWRRLSVTVGGNDVTAYLYHREQIATLPDGPEIGRATITLRINTKTSEVIDDWDEVVIKAGVSSATVTVWGGYVTRRTYEPESDTGGEISIMTLDCQSYALRLSTTQPIDQSFSDESAGDPTTDTDIVGTLVQTYLPAFYDAATISGTSAHSMEYIEFSDETLRQALQKVVNITRKEYGVLPSKKFYYRPTGGGTTYAYRLADNPDEVTTYPMRGKPLYDVDSVDRRNAVRVVGGWTYSEIITDTFIGDGSTTDFDLTYRPAVVINITVDGVEQTVGIDFVDDPADFDVLVNYDTAQIKFTVAVTFGKEAVCYYRYNVRPDVTYIDAAGVSAMGGTIWAKTIRDDSISGTVDAYYAGSVYLAHYGTSLYRAQVTTVHSGTAGGTIVPWEPGANVYINADGAGLVSAQLMTIKGVTLRAEPRPGGAGYCLVYWDLDLGGRFSVGSQLAGGYRNQDVRNQAYPPLMLANTGFSPGE